MVRAGRANTVATISNAGNAQFNGTLQVGGTSQSAGTMTVRNNADAEVDYYLWPGLTTSQKGSFTYKDWNGNSQWYMVKDASNNWALNSATGGLDSFKAYQSTNSGDTYINASNSTGHVRLNYENGSGAETDIYSGSSANLDAAFLGPTSIKFPGLAASSGHSCLQVDTSGYLTNTGSACGTGSGASGTINSGNSGQIAYYTASGTTVGGMNAVPVSAGGTGATSATSAVANLLPGVASDGNDGVAVAGNMQAQQSISGMSPYIDIRAYGAVIDGATDIGPSILAAMNAYASSGNGKSATILLPCGTTSGQGCYLDSTSSFSMNNFDNTTFKFILQGYLKLGSTLVAPTWQQWQGEGVSGVQFQRGSVGGIYAPNVNGTIGTALTGAGPSTFTPVFSNGNIAHVPPGSAITISGNVTASGTGTRVTNSSNGLGFTTLTLTSTARIPQGALVTVTGCSDSTMNTTNNVVVSADWSAKTISYWQSTSSASTATGCTVTGQNDDAFETDRVLCSNGVSATNIYGGPYTCGAGQITIMNKVAHSASDQWGAVAITSSLATASMGGQVFSNLAVSGCLGACLYFEGQQLLTLDNVGANTAETPTAIPLHLTSSGFNVLIHSPVLSASNTGQNQPPCAGGNCTQPAYPFAMRCDGDVSGFYYGSATNSCGALIIDREPVFYGAIRTDLSALPTIRDFPMWEEPPGYGVLVDNRSASTGQQCLDIESPILQDNVFLQPNSVVSYTDNEPPAGCAIINNPANEQALTGQYFNGALESTNAANYESLPTPVNGSGPNGVQIDGFQVSGQVEAVGAGLEPHVLPYALAPATAPASLSNGTGFTVTPVRGPDGTTSNAAEIDATRNDGGGAWAATYTGTTSAGDAFIYGVMARPGANQSQVAAALGSTAASRVA